MAISPPNKLKMRWRTYKLCLTTLFLLFQTHYSSGQLIQNSIGWYSHVHNFTYDKDTSTSPLFTNIWFPVPSHHQSVNKAELFPVHQFPSYDSIAKALADSNQKYYQYYNLSEELVSYSPIELTQQDKDSLYQIILNFHYPYQRVEELPALKDYPVILYHHGSQSNINENLELMEYFVSTGKYIFISTNYHLPNGKYFGLSEGVSSSMDHEQALLNWVKSNTDQNIYLIGHSWGAQKSMLLALNNPSIAGLVSLETTIEFKSDSAEIGYKWPYIYNDLASDQKLFNMPSLLIANTLENQPFPFFLETSNSIQYHVTAKDTLDHESFLSEHFDRYKVHYTPSIPDSVVLKKQYDLYHSHLELIYDFVDGIENDSNEVLEKHLNKFYIIQVN